VLIGKICALIAEPVLHWLLDGEKEKFFVAMAQNEDSYAGVACFNLSSWQQLKREELAAFDDSDGNNTGWPLYCAIAYRAYLILSLNRSVTDRLLKRLETEDVITGTGIRGLKRAPKLLEGELLGLNTRMSAEDLLPKEALRKVDRPSVTFTAKELRDMRFK